MKQIYYTSCRLGHSVNGQSGYQVRAVTPGLEYPQLRAAIVYAGYKPPDSVAPTAEAIATAPLRLALIESPDLGRILLHSAYVGREGTGTRFGNFFTHLILNLPHTVTARDAARLWGSPFWQNRDGDLSKDLPEANLPCGEALGLDPKQLLRDERGQGMLRFLLDALLLPQHADRRIFLAAPAQDVACCLYAATTVLPPGLISSLTFSTYEYAPLACRARVVGADPGVELPAGCYSGSCVGFHSVSGRKSALGGATPFAENAVRIIAHGKLTDLDNFAKWCAKLQVADKDMFELAFRLKWSKEYTPTEEEVRSALEQGGLGKEVLKRDAVIEQLSLQNCRLAMENRKQVEELFAHSRALEKIVGWGRTDASFHLGTLPLVLNHLAEMEEDRPLQDREGLSDDTRHRLRGWLDLRRLERMPSLHEDLKRVGNVLGWSPGAARQTRLEALTDALAGAYLAEPGNDPQAMLEQIVLSLAPTPEEYTLVYQRFCDFFIGRAGELLRPALACALVAVGFHQCASPDLRERLGESAGQRAEAFIRALKNHKKKNLLLVIRNGGRDWPSDVREQLRRLIPLPLWKRLRRRLRSWPVRILLLLALIGLAFWGIKRHWNR